MILDHNVALGSKGGRENMNLVKHHNWKITVNNTKIFILYIGCIYTPDNNAIV